MNSIPSVYSIKAEVLDVVVIDATHSTRPISINVDMDVDVNLTPEKSSYARNYNTTHNNITNNTTNNTTSNTNTTSSNITTRRSSDDNIGLYHARQSLIGGGMYTYDEVSDDEDQVQDLLIADDGDNTDNTDSDRGDNDNIGGIGGIDHESGGGYGHGYGEYDNVSVLSPTAIRISTKSKQNTPNKHNIHNIHNTHTPNMNSHVSHNYGSMDNTKI